MEWLNGVMLMSIFCRQGKEIWNDSTVAMTKKGKFIKTWNIRCRQQRLTISCLFSEDTQKPLHGKTFYFDAPESTRVTRLQRKVCYLGGVSVEQVVSFVRSNLVECVLLFISVHREFPLQRSGLLDYQCSSAEARESVEVPGWWGEQYQSVKTVID